MFIWRLNNINSFNVSGPNGLAYDSGNGILYYVTYPFNSTLGYADLYQYKVGEITATKIYDLGNEIACADFYQGKYYYIAGGDKGATDDLYEVIFNPNGTVKEVIPHIGISENQYAWRFYGDIAISTEGLIYGVGRNESTGAYQFFSVKRDGTGFVLIDSNLGMPLQLAFGSDGILYGFNINNGYYYTIDLDDGDTVKTVMTKTSGLNLDARGFNDMASGIKYYNFKNQTTLGEVPALKFYDANLNGIFDNGDSAIEGWKIEIVDDQDEVVDTKFTDADGLVNFEVPYGTYTIREVMPNEIYWKATTDTQQTVTVERLKTAQQVDFGNVCLGKGGGLTLGFWSNKNGGALFGTDDLDLLKSLSLVKADGSLLDPKDYPSFRSWLLSATADNMAYMLSAQLAAMELNVLNGKVTGDSWIYAPGVDGPYGNGFITVNDLMSKANAALLDGETFAGDTNRATQEALKNVLDRANNNLNFVQPGPCSFTKPY